VCNKFLKNDDKNQGKKIKLVKVDSGSGFLIILAKIWLIMLNNLLLLCIKLLRCLFTFPLVTPELRLLRHQSNYISALKTISRHILASSFLLYFWWLLQFIFTHVFSTLNLICYLMFHIRGYKFGATKLNSPWGMFRANREPAHKTNTNWQGTHL
jgi:hypothetical protein